MEDSDISALAEQAPNMMRAMGPGFFSSLVSFIPRGQDRKNLAADRAVVASMLESGETNFRFRGLAMELETFADAQQEEIERLVTNQVNAILKADSVVDWSKANPDEISPEFRHRWLREASNVSDETLQDLWARLLAGELESPGSVSNDTMSIARDLTKERAEKFQILCSAALCHFNGEPMVVVGCGDPSLDSLRPYGLPYGTLLQLVHHRLIVSNMRTGRQFTTNQTLFVVPVRQQDLTWRLSRSSLTGQRDSTHFIRGLALTPAGEQLFTVVEKTPVPEYTAAMVSFLEQEGWDVLRVT